MESPIKIYDLGILYPYFWKHQNGYYIDKFLFEHDDKFCGHPLYPMIFGFISGVLHPPLCWVPWSLEVDGFFCWQDWKISSNPLKLPTKTCKSNKSTLSHQIHQIFMACKFYMIQDSRKTRYLPYSHTAACPGFLQLQHQPHRGALGVAG